MVEYRYAGFRADGIVLDATINNCIKLLNEMRGQGRLMEAYYKHYKMIGFLDTPADERQFMDEMRIMHIFDQGLIQFLMMVKRSKKPIKEEILKITRFENDDGKEYVRFATRLTSEGKHGERMITNIGYNGVWDEPVFKQTYDRKLEEWVPTLEVDHTIKHCDYEWNTQTVKELSKLFDPKIAFFIMGYGRSKYQISREDWTNLDRATIVSRENQASSIRARTGRNY